MKIIGIIPARYASTRFPGKPLVDIRGKSMIQRVYEQASKCTALAEVVVATDDVRIVEHVKTFGKVVMTDPGHMSGTDRCLEAITLFSAGRYADQDVIINIQGDEPFIHPLQIELLIGAFASPEVGIASLCKKIESQEELFDENTVKVVMNHKKHAIYFSRSPIPFFRDLPRERWHEKGNYYKHIGMYGYRIGTLKEICNLSRSMLEKTESLEQLRWIENGYHIMMNETGMQHLSIDTPEDLKKALEL